MKTLGKFFRFAVRSLLSLAKALIELVVSGCLLWFLYTISVDSFFARCVFWVVAVWFALKTLGFWGPVQSIESEDKEAIEDTASVAPEGKTYRKRRKVFRFSDDEDIFADDYYRRRHRF